MRQSIIVKFLPAGVRGSRLKATASGGESLTVPYQHSMPHRQRHAAAAFLLAQKLDWYGLYVAGPLNDSGPTVFVPFGEVEAGGKIALAGRYGSEFGFEGEDWFFLPDESSLVAGSFQP